MKSIVQYMQTVCATSQLLNKITTPTRSIRWQFPRAFVASAIAAVLDFGILVLLVEWARLKPELAATVSYLCGGVVNYFLCAKWVFPAAPKSLVVGFTFFTVLSLIGLGITWLCIFLLHGNLGIHYILAKGIALGLAFCWNFLSRRFFLFQYEK